MDSMENVIILMQSSRFRLHNNTIFLYLFFETERTMAEGDYFDYRIFHPARVLCVGPSSSGWFSLFFYLPEKYEFVFFK